MGLALWILNLNAGIYDSWQYRVKIQFYPSSENTLGNFPALVILGTNIAGFNYTQFVSRADGADLRFTTADKTTPLDYEIEKWNTNGSSFIWVKIPSLTYGSYIYGYWGKSGVSALPCTTNGAVWSNNYVGVWHFKGDEPFNDATSYRNNGVNDNTDYVETGRIGNARNFDTYDEIRVPRSSSLEITDVITMEGWVKLDSYPSEWNVLMIKGDTGANRQYGMWIRSTGDILLSYYASGNWYSFYPGGQGFTIGAWHHIAGVIDTVNNVRNIYIDGNLVASDGTDIPSMSSYPYDLYMGAIVNSWPCDGTFDEFRISRTARNAAWVNATYRTVMENSSFQQYGSSLRQGQLGVEAYDASDVRAYSAVANGEIAMTNSLPTANVYVCWDHTDKGTSATSAWSHVTYVGNLSIEQRFSQTLNTLLPNTNYVYRCYAVNAGGNAWSLSAKSFRTCRAWYVASSGSGVDGKSWASAYNTIQVALNAATNGADVIHVKGETFSVTTPLSWTKPGVIVRGGYEGSGAPGNHDPVQWSTVINRSSGETRILNILNASNGKLEYVTICGGLLTGSGTVGGGILITNSANFTIDSCIISNNTAGALGGGIYAFNCSQINIKNSIIVTNIMDVADRDWTRYGGGIYMRNCSGVISNCVIKGNVARNTRHGWSVTRPNGGGITIDGGNMTIARTIIRNNRVWNPNYWEVAMYGGGVYVAGGAHVLKNCLINTNEVVSVTSSTELGEGVYVAGGNVVLQNCTVADNNNEGVREYAGSAVLIVSNSVVYGHAIRDIGGSIDAYYSCIGDGTKAGQYGCFSNNPTFVDRVYYHEKSEYGDYRSGYFSGGTWSTSTNSSMLIDRGNPAAVFSAEPHPNGARLNIGVYGNTEVAAKSPPLTVRVLSPNAITPTSATLNAEVVLPGSPDVKVWFYWGFINGGTNASQWLANTYGGLLFSTGQVSKVINGLLNNSNYYYTIFASNSAGGIAWAVPSTNFVACAHPPEIANRGVENETGPTVTLKGELTSDGGVNTRVFVCWGPEDGGNSSTANWAHVVDCGLKGVGNFQVNITTEVGSNYYYTCLATNMAGQGWAVPCIPFGHARIRYVSSSATGRNNGYTWTDAFSDIGSAIAGCVAGKTNIIYIKGGNYLLETELLLTNSCVYLLGSYQGVGFPGNYNIATWPTVIKRQGSGITRLMQINGANNCVLRAIKFQDGYREGTGIPSGCGGALYIVNTSNPVSYTHLTLPTIYSV